MMKRLMQSLVFRLSLFFALASTMVLLILSFIVTRSIDQHFIEQDQHDLMGRMAYIEEILASVDNQEALKKVFHQFESSLLAIAILDNNQRVKYISPGVVLPQQYLSDHAESLEMSTFSWRDTTGEYRGLHSKFKTNYPELSSGTVILGLEISHHQVYLESLLFNVRLSVVIATLLLGSLGWLVARHGLKPLYCLTQMTSEITVKKLNKRLPDTDIPLELQELTKTLNEMLERLKNSFDRLLHFSSDLAHELRTPLSHLKTQTQVILSRPRTIYEYRETLYSNVEEFDHLSKIVSSMLFLAKSDNGLNAPVKEKLALHKELVQLIEFYELFAGSRRITIETNGEGYINGDKTMIRQALSNLIVNAVKNAFEDSVVKVNVKTVKNQVIFEIKNQGKTIPEKHLPHLFDRFYRVDPDRFQSSQEQTSVGLGLAITDSIVKSHEGHISVLSENETTVFTIIFPAYIQ